jgi:hypothetical protein
LVQSAAKTVLALAAPQGGGARRLGGHRLLILGSLYSSHVERRFVRAIRHLGPYTGRGMVPQPMRWLVCGSSK